MTAYYPSLGSYCINERIMPVALVYVNKSYPSNPTDKELQVNSS